MNIDAINFETQSQELLNSSSSINKNGTADFEKWLKSEISEINTQINTADGKLQKLATGEYNNLHDVMLSMEKAKISFQLGLEVRNKLLEGYQEIMRMQV